MSRSDVRDRPVAIRQADRREHAEGARERAPARGLVGHRHAEVGFHEVVAGDGEEGEVGGVLRDVAGPEGIALKIGEEAWHDGLGLANDHGVGDAVEVVGIESREEAADDHLHASGAELAREASAWGAQ